MSNKIIDPFTNEEIEFIDPFAEQENKGGLGKAFGAGVDKLQELGYRAVKGFAESGENPDDYETGSISRSVAEVIGQNGSLSQFADEGIKRNLEEQKGYEPTVKSYKDIDSLGDAASYTGELVAGSLPYMAGAMTPIGAATMAGGLSEEAYDAQPDNEKNTLKAVASGSGQMLMERLGIKGSLGQIGKDILKDGVVETAKRLGKGELVDAVKDGSFAKRILKGSLWEGTTEMGQEALAQWGAGKDINDIGGLDEAFVGGLVVGGVIRTSSEGAQRVFSWQKKSAPIAKNGIDELVKQGVPQDEAINQVRAQLIKSGIKQGLPEVESVASAARTMQMEYGIENDLFQPIANDVASRRAAMNERLNQQRIEGGIGDVKQSLSSGGAPTSDELVHQQMKNNAPEFFEQLDEMDQVDESQATESDVNNITQPKEELPSQVYKGKDKALIDTFGDSLLTQAVIQRGGLNRKDFELPDDLFKRGANFINGVVGKPIFPKNGGMTADDFVEFAKEQGVDFEYGNDGVAYVQDLIAKVGSEGKILSDKKLSEKFEAEQQEQNLADQNQSDISLTQAIINNFGEQDSQVKQLANNVIAHFGEGKNLEQAIDIEISKDPDNAAIFIDKALALTDQEINHEQARAIAEEKGNVGAQESGISEAEKQQEIEAEAIFGKGKKPIPPIPPIPDKLPRTDEAKDSKESFFMSEENNPAPKAKADKIDDFGEVLQGANKHNYTYNEKLNEDVDVKTVPLSKSFPQPDYEKLSTEGADPRALAFIAQLRGEIKSKPRQSHKVERWSHQVSSARHNSKKLLEMGEGGSDIMIASLKKSEAGYDKYLKYLPYVLDIAKEIPAKNIKELGNFKLTHAFYNMYHKESNVHKWVVTNITGKSGFGGMGDLSHFDTVEEAVAHIKSQVTDEKIINGKKLAKFDVWTERGKKGIVFVGKKLAPRKFIELKQFSNTMDARRYINENNEALVALLKSKKKIKAHRRSDNNPRIGADHRKGIDATAEMFDKAFGFRGVQFGNWVEGHKRQNDLNYAYDGLMDLAGILDLPAKALSLNGDLGLAFGARGKGGDNAAMAHYEPGSVVINLTKKMGAGSLAHEWWHALDNYFSKMDSSKLGGVDKSFITEGGRRLGIRKDGKHQRATSEDFGVRQEVYDAFTSLTKAIKTETKLVERSAELDKLRGKDYWGTVIEMTARSFERYVIDKLASQGYESDYLANIVKESSTEASKEISDYPYPLAVEMDVVNKAYDHIFDTLQTKETDRGVVLFSAKDSNNSYNDVVSEEQVLHEFELFIKEFSGVSDVNLKIGTTEADTFGSEISKGKGRVFGGYNPTTNTLYIARGAFTNVRELRTTIHHELLVHKGLGLYSETAQKALLDGILYAVAKGEPTLKKLWGKVLKAYPSNKNPPLVQAEELLALISEEAHSFWNSPRLNKLLLAFREMLRKLKIIKTNLGKAELINEIHKIGQQLALGRKPIPRPSKPQKSKDNIPPTEPENNILFRREGEGVTIADESLKDNVIRIMQDKFRRLKLIQRELSVNDSNDAYQAEEAFHGKVGEDLRALENKHTDKIADTMAKHNLSQDEVDLYLIAKHASERNAYIDTINPELDGTGSGMSNESAQAVLDKAIFEKKRLALEDVANHVYAMLKQNRNMMVQFDLEAQDAIDTWQQQYQFYVPLKGYAAEDGVTDGKGKKFGTGKGFNIKGRETIKAMGRRSLAESPLLHSISDTTRAVIRARKNEVGNTFLKLVNDNPDPELWQIFSAENPDKKRDKVVIEGIKTIGLVNMTAFEMKSGEEYFTTKVDGTETFVKIKDPLLARAMGNLGVDEANVLTQNLGKITRLLSALVTTWNPEFMITNFTRDVQAAVANLLAETQVKDGKALNTNGLVKKMTKSLPKAMTVLKHGFRENNFDDSDWGSYLKEFLQSGAKTGWVNQKDLEGLANELKGSISRASNTNAGKVKRAGKAVADFVRDYNDIVENAARFSVYYHARKQGVTVKKASSLAKNLTINFNRKGEIGNTLNATYMFANAGVQGTANMLRALATPKDRSKSMWNLQFYNLSQKLAIGSIGATVLMANAMRELGGDDEDGVAFYDKIPDFVKTNNFIIMTGGKDYITIPMPYGYNVLAAVGHAIDGVIEGKSVGKQAANLLMASVSAFSPIGMQESSSVEKAAIRTLSPSVLKPFAEMATNENFFGGNIFPKKLGHGAEKSDANLGDEYTWEWTKNFTTWINEVTGGSKFRSGSVDIAPQSIDHLVKFMGGGVLQFAMRWQNLASKSIDGKEIQSRDIPFFRRFYKQLNPKATIGEFYEAKGRLNKYQADYNSLYGAVRAEFKKSYSNHLLLHNYAVGIEKSLKNLNKQKRSIEASRLNEKAKEDRIQKIEDRKIELSLRFFAKKNKLGLNNLN